MLPQESSFERIFQTKSLSGDNKAYCNECNKKTEATYVSFKIKTNCRQVTFYTGIEWKGCMLVYIVFNSVSCVIQGCEMVKSPQILTLLLKRFDFDYNTMSHFKSQCCVDVPLTLQIKARESIYVWFLSESCSFWLLLKSFHVPDCVLRCRRRSTNCTGWWITWGIYTVDITQPPCPMRTKPGMSVMILRSTRWGRSYFIYSMRMIHIRKIPTETLNGNFLTLFLVQVKEQPFAKTGTYKYVW